MPVSSHSLPPALHSQVLPSSGLPAHSESDINIPSTSTPRLKVRIYLTANPEVSFPLYLCQYRMSFVHFPSRLLPVPSVERGVIDTWNMKNILLISANLPPHPFIQFIGYGVPFVSVFLFLFSAGFTLRLLLLCHYNPQSRGGHFILVT